MPFTLITGSFRVLNKTPKGNSTGFSPDGDSVQFKPDKPSLLKKLARVDKPYKLTAIGSLNLRLEGIDALELHFTPQIKGAKEAFQPRPLADDSRGFLTKQLGLDPLSYKEPQLLRVLPPASHDGEKGYILSRSLDVHGRPVSFVFHSRPPQEDGASVTLTAALLKESFNYDSLVKGYSYPLFYDTLFAELRNVLQAAAIQARKGNTALWNQDKTTTGVVASCVKDLEDGGVIFPKLFRRLVSYYAKGGKTLSNFLLFPELKAEQVQDLDPNSPTFTNFTHFDNMVQVDGDKVRLRQAPETILFVSEK